MHMRMGLLLTSFVTLPPSALAAWVPLRPSDVSTDQAATISISRRATASHRAPKGWRANTDNNLLTNSRGGN